MTRTGLFCAALGLAALAGCATDRAGLPDAQLPDYEPNNRIEPLKPEPIVTGRGDGEETSDADDELLGGPE